MAEDAGYRPGRARGARVEKDGQQKDGERWTLILVRELRHPPELVWEALTEPAQLAEWAPYDADRSLAAEGAAKLTWTGTGQTVEAAVTRAAEALHLTQSAVSAAIAALESHYGVSLFHRVGRRIELNEEGRLFLGEARAVLARASAAELALSELSGLKRGTLSVQASQTIASYWLPQRLVAFRCRHPQLEIQVTIGNTAQVAKAVADGVADCEPFFRSG